MEIPADCLIYRAVNVVSNESAITGETHEVYKNTMDKCL
jgi:magnesium-transporting ATPase (P-type)